MKHSSARRRRGPNPLIAFQSTATTVTIDPTGQLKVQHDEHQWNMCTCAAQNIYIGGYLRNNVRQVPMTYFCLLEQCQSESTTDLNGTPCECAAKGITNGHLENSQSLTSDTYYCTAN